MFRGRLFFVSLLAAGAIISSCAIAYCDSTKVTREYLLRHVDVSVISRVINVMVRDATNTRVIGGSGKRLVITDTSDQQDAIAQILPVLDQPLKETDPGKMQMRMIMNASQYLRSQKLANLKPASGGVSATGSSVGQINAANAHSTNIVGGVKSYDTFTAAKPYKSIYASDDAKLVKAPRLIFDEPTLTSLSALQLKGIFRSSSASPLALLWYEGVTYTARDGGLFENNHKKLKNVTSKVMRDRVILTGPDRIPREIRFRTSL